MKFQSGIIYKNIIDSLSEGLYFVDTNNVITYWNQGAERITGFSTEEVVGLKCSDNILTHIDKDGNSLCKGNCPLRDSIADGKERENEVFLHHKQGHRVPVLVRTNPMFDESGKLIGGFEVFTDITNQFARELRIKELEELSQLDYLTKLSNRLFLENEVASRLAEYQRNGLSFGILFIDIDHFKDFNDTYGHDLGDKILQFTANTLSKNCRPFDIYGRWGGEEFLGIIKNINLNGLISHGNHVKQLIDNSYLLYNNQKLSVTISIGATTVRKEDTAKSIIKRADELLYNSKDEGRNKLSAE